MRGKKKKRMQQRQKGERENAKTINLGSTTTASESGHPPLRLPKFPHPSTTIDSADIITTFKRRHNHWNVSKYFPRRPICLWRSASIEGAFYRLRFTSAGQISPLLGCLAQANTLGFTFQKTACKMPGLCDLLSPAPVEKLGVLAALIPPFVCWCLYQSCLSYLGVN